MKKIVTIGLLFIWIVGFSQNAQLYDEASVSVKPEFPGGEKEFEEFISANFMNPGGYDAFQYENLDVKFIVETDGSLTEIKPVVMGKISNWHTEAVRVVSQSPKWKPARRDKKPVRCIVKRTIVNPYSHRMGGEAVEAIPEISPGSAAITEDENRVYNVADIEKRPEFPGGIQNFNAFVAKNFRVPDEPNLRDKVFVTFIVEKDGSLSDIRVVREAGYGTGKEAVRVLKTSPKWIPGEQNGRKVRVMFICPVILPTNK